MAGLDQRRVRPVAGDGVVVRVPGLLAVIAPGSGDGPALVADACRLAATDGPSPAAAIFARLASLAAPGERPLPAVAVLADGPAGLTAVVHGPATVTAGPTVVTSTPGSVTTRDLPDAPVVDLRLPGDGPAEPVAVATELAGGTIGAAGAVVADERPRLTLTTARPTAPAPSIPSVPGPPAAGPPSGPSSRPAAPPATPPPSASATPSATPAHVPASDEATPPPFRSVLLVDAEPDPTDRRAPLPIAAGVPSETGAPAANAAPIVEGVLCDQGHLNDVAAARCRECGEALSLADGRRHTGPRPPLGLLVFDDGATYVLDTDYVIGRAPGGDPLVVAGRARPLTLDDDERTVSRVHAELRLEGWQVVLSDRGSTNGTFWWDGAAARWVRLVPSEARRLQPGDRAAIGRRVLTFETRTADEA